MAGREWHIVLKIQKTGVSLQGICKQQILIKFPFPDRNKKKDKLVCFGQKMEISTSGRKPGLPTATEPSKYFSGSSTALASNQKNA